MIFDNSPKVKLLRDVDASGHFWCDRALLFSVKNGKGTLTHVGSEVTEDNLYYSQFLLCGEPLIQGEYPVCPTCRGLLAAGYGTENIDCPELKAVRESLNSDHTDLHTSFEKTKPLLGLLDDGIYMLADVPHYPTDGEGNFFYSVKNKLTEYSAACDTFYSCEIRNTTYCFPAFLFPTQSAELCSMERVNEYVFAMEKGASFRGLAYCEYGFFSALLDGHHKACAAAILGKPINCLTIIPPSRCYTPDGIDFKCKKPDKTPVRSVFFGDIEVPALKGEIIGDYCRFGRDKSIMRSSLRQFILTGKSFPEAEKNLSRYPTAKQLASFAALGFERDNISLDDAFEWIKNINNENFHKLRCCLGYFILKDRGSAYKLAKEIIRREGCGLPYKEAWKTLLCFKSDETENLFIDYLVSHTKEQECYDIVNSYWDQGEFL